MNFKYNSKQKVIDNILFDSESEALYYEHLKKRRMYGEIEGLVVHPQFVLVPPFVYENKQIKATIYTPDFLYRENDKTIVVEIKGFAKSDYELRVKMFKYLNPNFHFVELTYTKTLGFLPTSESKKQMKKVREEKIKEKTLKLKQQEEDKKAKRINYLNEHINTYMHKHRNKAEDERLSKWQKELESLNEHE